MRPRWYLLLLGPIILRTAIVGTGTADETSPKSTSGVVRGRIEVVGGSSFQKPDLTRAVVYLASDPKLDRDSLPGKRPQLSQHDKAFEPDLLVVPRGTVVEFPNWDPFSHNVFSRSRAASFDLDRYPHGQSKSYQFNEVGIVQVFCNIHPQMKSTVVVVPNRFFARADALGRVQLSDVPYGQYEVVAWIDRCDEQRHKIQLDAKNPVEVAFTLQESRGRVLADQQRERASAYGVERGLGLKRERLNLPAVEEAHPAPRKEPQR